MGRKNLFATASTFMAILAVCSAQSAVVESSKINFTDKATPLNFNFAGQPELSLIKDGSTLVGIESYWTFTPGAGQSGQMDLLANLYSPSFASGVDTKVGFSTTVDLSKGAQQASSTYSAQQGLTFSSQVLSTLLNGSPGMVPAELVGAGAGFSNLDTFFAAGGTAEGYIKLITTDPAPTTPGGPGTNPPPTGGGGGDRVPEPASMLVWGCLAVGAYVMRRKKQQPAVA